MRERQCIVRRRNIKSVLRNKINEWLESIDNKAVRDAIAPHVIVSGGSIASMLMGEKINDFDVYFRTGEAAEAAARYYVEKFKANPPTRFAGSDKLATLQVQRFSDRIKVVVKSVGIAGESGTDEYRYFEQVDDDAASTDFVENVAKDAQETEEPADKGKYRPKFLTSNAITLSHRMQIVIRFFGEPADIHRNYDFVHCMCAWDAANGQLHIPQEAVESMLARHLVYRGSLYPLCSLIRTRKFIAKGWTIDAGQYVKMGWDLNQLDLKDIRVLEDQMVGVDAAYFYEVLRLLREQNGERVDGAYLMQVIDRVFG